jgi:hypothetical protein
MITVREPILKALKKRRVDLPRPALSDAAISPGRCPARTKTAWAAEEAHRPRIQTKKEEEIE